MINFDDVTEENIKGHNPNWSQFPDHPYIILIIGSKKYQTKFYTLFHDENFKRELQQIAFKHSTDINFRDFMNLYKKSTAEPYSFLVIDDTLASDNPSRFRKNLLGRI